MTLDQLRVFVAVAEREHLTRAAEALHLTPSAVSAAIHGLEQRYGANLFNRVGRRIELSGDGRLFLVEAQAALASARTAELALTELGGLKRGALAIEASQTLTSYWLPPILMAFRTAHPAIGLTLAEGNTASTIAAVLDGRAEIGLVEDEIDAPALAVVPIDDDRLALVAAPDHPLAARPVSSRDLATARWVMRETGSGTRALFERAMEGMGVHARDLDIVLELPTNEAVCLAVQGWGAITVVSELVAVRHIEAGRLTRLDWDLPVRKFALLRHKERFRTKAARAFEALLQASVAGSRQRRAAVSFDI